MSTCGKYISKTGWTEPARIRLGREVQTVQPRRSCLSAGRISVRRRTGHPIKRATVKHSPYILNHVFIPATRYGEL